MKRIYFSHYAVRTTKKMLAAFQAANIFLFADWSLSIYFGDINLIAVGIS
ncbi:hypothetical protein DI53_0072 [Sphingobacterium deserti]|uniref:Uncharacterized protein n=1 Tax=Sphingobacterium deserti TaxID=1229276 RepID=A0A0B8T380_9SPHI|nr:hypothetical protein DI53_0072 [Sphingobacterium deserti]